MAGRIKVFVLLPHRLDAEKWASDYRDKLVPDRSPYGYHYAEEMGCDVVYSKPSIARNPVQAIWRKALVALFGFDIRHSILNRRAMFAEDVDVIWTHTEFEYLGCLLLMKLRGRKAKTPKIIAQSIWLVDRWPRLTKIRKAFYRSLLKEASVATFHSVINTREARTLGLAPRVEIVRFGISTDSFPLKPYGGPRGERPLRILALGNDMHRDWETFAEAFGNRDEFDVKVGSPRSAESLKFDKLRNFEVRRLKQSEILESYRWADCVVVPLKANCHVSGITVIMEGVTQGKPVITNDQGGLSDYFDGSCVRYVSPSDAQALRNEALSLDGSDQSALVGAAQARLEAAELTTIGFTKRHVELSRSLLEGNRSTAAR